MDESILRTLGLLDDVYFMIYQVSCTQFFNMKFPTYKCLTLDCLCCIEVHVLYG